MTNRDHDNILNRDSYHIAVNTLVLWDSYHDEDNESYKKNASLFDTLELNGPDTNLSCLCRVRCIDITLPYELDSNGREKYIDSISVLWRHPRSTFERLD
jgi:hypothetical protein